MAEGKQNSFFFTFLKMTSIVRVKLWLSRGHTNQAVLISTGRSTSLSWTTIFERLGNSVYAQMILIDGLVHVYTRHEWIILLDVQANSEFGMFRLTKV